MVKKIFLIITILITAFIVWINIKLYLDNFSAIEKQEDILLQLKFIESELKNNDLGNRMQAIFPEGFVFANVLYGLSWCEVGLGDKTGSKELKNKAIREALYAYKELDSEEARRVFDSSLTPENGIFYVGWKNYLLSKVLLLDTTFVDYNNYKNVFRSQCGVISHALHQSPIPYLPSYENQTWPADMFVAMASLTNYDRIYTSKYKQEISSWITNIKSKLDPFTKMIPHKVDTKNGTTIEGARGCSISLILRLLYEIDAEFSKEQFNLYNKYFVTTTFGLPSVREYPKGKTGLGDIDSGPVIFGVGFSGTIVSIGTFAMMEDFVNSEKQYKTVNAFGFNSKSQMGKKYLFGQLPIADAFIAWGRSTELNNKLSKTSLSNWRLQFQLLSLFILGLLWLPFYYGKITSAFFFYFKKL
jgi:hypothetical protein